MFARLGFPRTTTGKVKCNGEKWNRKYKNVTREVYSNKRSSIAHREKTLKLWEFRKGRKGEVRILII
jgi:hypothetical protein